MAEEKEKEVMPEESCEAKTPEEEKKADETEKAAEAQAQEDILLLQQLFIQLRVSASAIFFSENTKCSE